MSSSNAAVMKSVNERSLEICHSCICYLNDRFVYEKGLFRSPASLTDVRLLQKQMMFPGNAETFQFEILKEKSMTLTVLLSAMTFLYSLVIYCRWCK